MDRKNLANLLVSHILHVGKTVEEMVDMAQFLLDGAYKKRYEDGKRDIVHAFRDEIKKR